MTTLSSVETISKGEVLVPPTRTRSRDSDGPHRNLPRLYTGDTKSPLVSSFSPNWSTYTVPPYLVGHVGRSMGGRCHRRGSVS